jgi:hypothetical protein
MNTFKTRGAQALAILTIASALSAPIQAHARDINTCEYVRNTICSEPASVLDRILALLSSR